MSLNKIELNDSDNLSTNELADKYQLAKSTISTIINPVSKKKLTDLFEKNLIDSSKKHLKLPTYLDIENALDLWFAETKKMKNVVINGPDLKVRDIKFGVMLNHL